MELGINQLIKMILGIFLVVAVVVSFYFFFKDYVSGLFSTYGNETPINLVLSLLK